MATHDPNPGLDSRTVFSFAAAKALAPGRACLGVSNVLFGLAIVSAFALLAAYPVQARADDDPSNEYHLTAYLYHTVTGDLNGFGRLGYFENPDEHKHTYQVEWPGLNYMLMKHVQLWGGLSSYYNDYEKAANTLELRPFGGVKLFLPNRIHWNIYSYTRYEYRATEDLDTYDWTSVHRVRSRFGVEFPLSRGERAWKPHTWYALADVEPYYRFDTDRLDPLKVRAGIAYVLSDRVRMEFIYTAGFSRPNGNGLEYTDNTFRLNFKIGLRRGLLGMLHEAASED